MQKVWQKSYDPKTPYEINTNDKSLVDLFDGVCTKYSDKRAVTCHGENLTFEQVGQLVNNLSESLIKLGVKPGDRVAVIMPNIIQYPITVFSILKIGAVVVNINPLYTESEMSYILQNSGAQVAFVMDAMARTLNKIHESGILKQIIVTSLADHYSFFKRHIFNFAIKYIKKINTSYTYKAHSYRDLLNGECDSQISFPKVKNTDIAFIQYTGATTGHPKGAILYHSCIVSNLCQIHAWVLSFMDNISDQVVINALPLYHIFSLTANLFTFFFVGAENVMIPNPRDIKDVVSILNSTPYTVFSGLDTLYNHLLNDERFRKSDFSKYKYSIAGGMPARQSVADLWYKVTGVHFTNCYGLTETSPAVTMNKIGDIFDGSVGYPISSTEVQIVDVNTHIPLAIGEHGLIWVRGPQVMGGYWNNPEQTKKALNEDGWFNTGDIGYLNEKGQLYISSRETELIIVSGFNVYPVEVELELDLIPQIKESAVIGRSDENTGESVNAFVVLHTKGSITEIDIRKKCKEKLAGYKVPKNVYIVDSLPKTLVGKIDKVNLAKKYFTNK